MTNIYTNHYFNSKGDPLVVECVLDLETAIDFASQGADYAFTVHVRDDVAKRIHLGAMISEYLADLAAERQWEDSRGVYA